MAITTRQQEGFTMPELEYMAQCEDITIVPLHRMERLELMRALMLKRSNRCRIVAPEWLSYEHLHNLCKREDQPDSMFTKLPFHYLEIAQILLTNAEDDLIDSQGVRRLIQDLREVRQSKTREGLRMLNPLQLQMDNLSIAEINEIRPLFAHSFDMLRRLDELAGSSDVSRQQSQNMFADQSYSEFDDTFSSSYLNPE
ncbi:Psf2-domain-containing protein [Coemansia reversa NRRL 1564]|uniref:DNA replication complex GINS protein PSF2 n=1 Tax=Coemansia reversa (strain ATCC 12441 / NRRL 1564) TaxID=763665 RepID=A0A2G5BJG6_COERN|nr:Psf2-domain-containing protein [Coemansia reversa NRRL 1564]|eukprot:PIA18897.1 Psf2-domain-containing protein [Coemansia reversa NRRL 1564]